MGIRRFIRIGGSFGETVGFTFAPLNVMHVCCMERSVEKMVFVHGML